MIAGYGYLCVILLMFCCPWPSSLAVQPVCQRVGLRGGGCVGSLPSQDPVPSCVLLRDVQRID